MTTDKPTPPAPITSTPDPTPAAEPITLSAAPTPVTTAHPTSAAILGGVRGGILTRDSCATTENSAKQETPRKWCSPRPSAKDTRLVPSSNPPVAAGIFADTHITGRPAEQNPQSPHFSPPLSTTNSPSPPPPPPS